MQYSTWPPSNQRRRRKEELEEEEVASHLPPKALSTTRNLALAEPLVISSNKIGKNGGERAK